MANRPNMYQLTMEAKKAFNSIEDKMFNADNVEELFDNEDFKALELNYETTIDSINEKAVSVAYVVRRIRAERELFLLEIEKMNKAIQKLGQVEARLISSVEGTMAFLNLDEIKDTNATWKFKSSEVVETSGNADEIDINNPFIRTKVEIKGFKDVDYLEKLKAEYPETKLTAEFDKVAFKSAIADERSVREAELVAQGLKAKDAKAAAKLEIVKLPGEENLSIGVNRKLNLE